MAALTLATFEMAARSGLVFYDWPGWALLVILAVVVAILVAKTTVAAPARRICVSE